MARYTPPIGPALFSTIFLFFLLEISQSKSVYVETGCYLNAHMFEEMPVRNTFSCALLMQGKCDMDYHQMGYGNAIQMCSCMAQFALANSHYACVKRSMSTYNGTRARACKVHKNVNSAKLSCSRELNQTIEGPIQPLLICIPLCGRSKNVKKGQGFSWVEMDSEQSPCVWG
ncbi:hypothetical protein M0R45_009988 [Rubus argutus]|uniref:Uncharacterized protein n=1 Tax=Rubus argutus TaxID=59490 RepID=A0AAW1Y6G8_RUBAR